MVGRRVRLGLLVVLTLGGGCSDEAGRPTIIGRAFDPVDWWHELEGGRIAEARPPPPNADAPYPTLAVVPAKPAAPDAAAHARIASALTVDRTNAQYTEGTVPITPPPPLPKEDTTLAKQGATADDSDTPNASMPAANAPPPPVVPGAPPAPSPGTTAVAPPPAPVASAAAQPVPASPAGNPPAATPTPPVPATPVQAAPVAVGGPMPTIPDAPPPPPQLAGVAAIPAVTAPVPPAVAPPAPPPAPAPDGPQIAIPFASGSAVLQANVLPTIKALAAGRGGARIAVVGFGDATATDPAAQLAALPLALDRARAVANQLQFIGVPGPVIAITAEPQGSGATARLVN
jgi:outer membrane protein OmpA-like peptidoglycan-associated protein